MTRSQANRLVRAYESALEELYNAHYNYTAKENWNKSIIFGKDYEIALKKARKVRKNLVDKLAPPKKKEPVINLSDFIPPW